MVATHLRECAREGRNGMPPKDPGTGNDEEIPEDIDVSRSQIQMIEQAGKDALRVGENMLVGRSSKVLGQERRRRRWR